MKNINVAAVCVMAVMAMSTVHAVQMGGAGHENVDSSFLSLWDNYSISLAVDKSNGKKKVGLGTALPIKDLDVKGEVQFEDVFIEGEEPTVSLTSGGVVQGLVSIKDNVLNILAGVGHSISFGANNVKSLLIDLQGNVGIGVDSVSPGLKLDVGGKVGATQYCDENGANCKDIANLAGGSTSTVVGDLVVGDCGLSAVFTAERGTVASDKTWSLGSGQNVYGTPMGCAGRVSKVAVMCSGSVGNSLDVYVYKNNIKTNCKVDLVKVVGKAVVADCDVDFVETDVLNLGAGTEKGNWKSCVGSFWVRYSSE